MSSKTIYKPNQDKYVRKGAAREIRRTAWRIVTSDLPESKRPSFKEWEKTQRVTSLLRDIEAGVVQV